MLSTYLRAVSSSNYQSVNLTWSVQMQAAKSGPELVKQPNHASAKVDATVQMSVLRVIFQLRLLLN